VIVGQNRAGVRVTQFPLESETRDFIHSKFPHSEPPFPAVSGHKNRPEPFGPGRWFERPWWPVLPYLNHFLGSGKEPTMPPRHPFRSHTSEIEIPRFRNVVFARFEYRQNQGIRIAQIYGIGNQRPTFAAFVNAIGGSGFQGTIATRAFHRFTPWEIRASARSVVVFDAFGRAALPERMIAKMETRAKTAKNFFVVFVAVVFFVFPCSIMPF
jgi:hypothetical protein